MLRAMIEQAALRRAQRGEAERSQRDSQRARSARPAFRAATQAQAARLGVAGWVRNLADGSVEAAIEGAPEAVEALVAFCRRGPRFAVVSEVLASDEAPEGLTGFSIR